MRLEEEHNGWALALERGRVEMIQIDFRLSLLVSDGPNDRCWLRIETLSKFRTAEKQTLIVPERSATLAPALSLFNVEVTAINIARVGHLEVTFGNGDRLEVAPDESYEAWQVECSTREGDMILVCPPGGDVVVFSRGRDPAYSAGPIMQ